MPADRNERKGSRDERGFVSAHLRILQENAASRRTPGWGRDLALPGVRLGALVLLLVLVFLPTLSTKEHGLGWCAAGFQAFCPVGLISLGTHLPS